MAARIREKLPLKYCHLANSAASLAYEIPSNNMCRPGLVLYGVAPIDAPWASQLRPAMALFARLTVGRTLPEGHGISYGGTYVTDHPTRVATVGIGYADGYLRSLAPVSYTHLDVYKRQDKKYQFTASLLFFPTPCPKK